MTLFEILQLAAARLQAGNLTEAQNICQQVLRQTSDQPQALNMLGVISYQLKESDRAVDYFRRATVADPRQVEFHFNLARLLAALHRWGDAAKAYRHVLDLSPKNHEALKDMGRAVHHCGMLREAAEYYRAALEVEPNDPATLNNLAGVLPDPQEAIECFKKAIALHPGFAAAHANMSNSLSFLHRYDEAIEAAQRSIALKGDSAGAHNNLGHALFSVGRVDEAIGCFQKATELNPANISPSSNRLFCMIFHPGYDAAALLRECRGWNDRHARPLAPPPGKHGNDPNPSRKLRVGYISPNFFQHSQAPFTVPLMRNHDLEQFEIYFYSDAMKSDSVTEMLKSRCGAWRNIAAAPDDAVAQQIIADKIDILIDLTMHMARGRPLVMARKPAPVQIAYLAYPGTTGLTAIDYRFTDAILDPPGITDGDYSEQSVRLPETFACFDPRAFDEPPAVGPLPAERNGYVTFGSLNSFFKLNPPLLAVWSRILEAVPRSRLRLLAPDGSGRDWALKHLPGDRVDFLGRMPRDPYLAEYANIDICLDTLPYNGHTTSLEALYQGVPVVTRPSARACGRAGMSILHNLGLSELAAENDEQWVAIAAGLAGDLPRLVELRRTLRQRMDASPLSGGAAFTRNVEAAYRKMWQTWCAQPAAGKTTKSITDRGNELCHSGDLAGGIECYRQALQLNPDHLVAQNNLANALAMLGRWEEAGQWYAKVMAREPNAPDVLRNVAKSLMAQNKPAEALALLDRLIVAHPDDAMGHFHRALAILIQGDLQRGLAEYEWRWKVPQLNFPFHAPGEQWNGQSIEGKRLFLHAEQGLGDAIQFVRFVPMVARLGGKINLAVHRDLRRLAEGIAPVDYWVSHGESPPPYDLHCPLLTLPRVLGTTLETIPAPVPYLTPPPELVEAWKERMGDDRRAKVGLVWAGRIGHHNDRNRSAALANFAPFAEVDSARFFSLQKGPAAEQSRQAPFPLTDWTGELNDLADTAALIANLDVVICVDTAVAHLAGAMDKPTLLLLPFAPDWRWLLNRPRTPWYPSMHLYRQPSHGDWTTPIAQITRMLRELPPACASR